MKTRKTTFLDIGTKSGVFLREIAKRLIKGLESEVPDLQERVDHILHKQLFGIATTELTSLVSRRTLYCSKYPNCRYSASLFDTVEGNIRFRAKKHDFVNGRCKWCGASATQFDRDDGLESHAYEFIHTDKPEEIFNMKFDVIVGNPPYQMSDGGGTGSSAMPIYHKFVLQAKKLNPRYLSMIIPSRWFTGGKGLDEFREAMLKDNRVREIHDFLNASECFPGVAIEGGVCYFLWDRDFWGLCKVYTHSEGNNITMSERPLLEEGSDVFIRYNKLISIIRKVSAEEEKSFASVVSSRNPYGIDDRFDIAKNYQEASIEILGVDNKKRVVKKIPMRFVKRGLSEVDSYRIFISKADGAAGQIGCPVPARIIGKTQIATPKLVCTETFLRIGPFKSKQEALNAEDYMRTKFFRALVGARKNKNMTQSTYSFVPMQDFSKPWSDEELYKKYKLTKEEIAFIESMIKPME